MDERRFDDLTKALASKTSRRRLARGLAGAGIGGLLSLVGGRRAGAQTAYGGHCASDGQCATAYCAKAANGNNRCACPAGASFCTMGGPCCPAGTRCVGGACQPVCPPGRTYCGGRCVDLAADPANCGSCGNACPTPPNATAICANEVCGSVCTFGSGAVCDAYGNCSAPTCCPEGTAAVCGGICAAGPGPIECCASDADCDDGNGCTLDVCGGVFHRCHHVAVSATCAQCATDGDCASGVCCHGRCCPDGQSCHGSSSGAGVCCQTCSGSGQLCCDIIVPGQLDLAACVGTIAPFCCPGGSGGQTVDDQGNVQSFCISPAFNLP